MASLGRWSQRSFQVNPGAFSPDYLFSHFRIRSSLPVDWRFVCVWDRSTRAPLFHVRRDDIGYLRMWSHREDSELGVRACRFAVSITRSSCMTSLYRHLRCFPTDSSARVVLRLCSCAFESFVPQDLLFRA